MLTVLDLFSGIGGFSLGLERTGGFRTVAFCEIDPFCRKVLAKHWPGVPCFEDVRALGREQIAGLGSIDAITGGFPRQDISTAGKRVGITGERSGLWSEIVRLIGVVRPRYAIVENVAALLHRGLDVVLADLAAVGFDAHWDCISASTIGAHHKRDRIWLVAYPSRILEGRQEQRAERERIGSGRESRDVPDGAGGRQSVRRRTPWEERHAVWRYLQTERRFREPTWEPEPDVGRVAHGVPARVDRLRSLGNAVVPQIPELIGRAILAAEGLTP